ncbi:MAG: PIG-L deacetylase family protein [Pseudomonadota bacterium]
MVRGSLVGSGGRVVVVSPHLDDGVLSMGTTIARLARAGTPVEVLTVFAGDLGSAAPASGWDARGGFATEGAATAGRRAEDREACRILGARAVWLPFADGDYGRARDAGEVWSAVAEVVDGAETVLLPGFPLTNPDHAWLTSVLLARPLPVRRVGCYVEQPYTLWLSRGELRGTPASSIEPELGWEWLPGGCVDRWAKWRAIRAYRSQLPLLGRARRRGSSLARLLFSDVPHAGEALRWLPPASIEVVRGRTAAVAQSEVPGADG